MFRSNELHRPNLTGLGKSKSFEMDTEIGQGIVCDELSYICLLSCPRACDDSQTIAAYCTCMMFPADNCTGLQ